MSPPPARVINSRAPVRICDNGGWTDTWFAQHGAIFNIAVSPYAEVQIVSCPSSQDTITLDVENYGERYTLDREPQGWQRHPLLEATIAHMGVPHGVALELTVHSAAPAGAATGTSAAITVALIGALAQLNGRSLGAHEVAALAHTVETERLRRESGIQDQLSSAYGGINYIEMRDYPHATVTPLHVRDDVLWELERRLALVYLGKGHDSSQVHHKVIAQLQDAGPDCKPLNNLRAAAARSRDALLTGDLQALAHAMIYNTEAQASLHAELVSRDARRVIEIARAHHALGWKVNGAGGDGGSLTILCGARAADRRAMLRAIESECAQFKHIPIRLSPEGLTVWESA